MLEIPMLDLSRIHEEIKDEIKEAVERVFKKSSFILGAEVEQFEKEFVEFTGTRHAIGVGSGTDAITISLLASGIGAGDEVITTSLSAYPTAEAILRTGAKPVYVDVCEDTFNLDPKQVESSISPKTKAIVPVHLYGLPADIGSLLEISKKHNLAIIEDCAQANGAKYQNKRVGTFGLAGCFSFFPSKNLGGIGDGGIIITDDDAIAVRARALRNHGEEGGRFSHKYLGFNSRLDGLHAAVLRVKLKHLERHNNERQKTADFYLRELAEASIALPLSSPSYPAEHVWHLFVVRVKDRKDRDSFRAYLDKNGVKTQVHYPYPLHHQEVFRVNKSLPIIEELVDKIVSLPLFPLMREEESRYVVETIKKWES